MATARPKFGLGQAIGAAAGVAGGTPLLPRAGSGKRDLAAEKEMRDIEAYTKRENAKGKKYVKMVKPPPKPRKKAEPTRRVGK